MVWGYDIADGESSVQEAARCSNRPSVSLNARDGDALFEEPFVFTDSFREAGALVCSDGEEQFERSVFHRITRQRR